MIEQSLSRVIPFVVAILLCDRGYVEPTTKKKTLLGIFDRVIARQFPTARPMAIYIRMTDAQGWYKFRIDYSKVGAKDILARVETDNIESPDRLRALELLVEPPTALPIPEPGTYEFRLYGNGNYLGRITFEAVLRSQGG